MKPTRFVAVFDTHGDMIDKHAESAFFDFLRFWKPTIRIHGGDAFDFRCLRRKASEEEQRERLGPDIDAGVSFLKRLRPTHFLRGNHDERLWDSTLSDDGKLAELGKFCLNPIMDALGDAKMLPYHKRDGVLRLGHLKVIHGYHSGVTAARQAGLIYGAVLMGHIHAHDTYALPGLERRVARACGCLAKLDMDYNRAQPQTLRQAHGWAYGFIFPGGEYQVWAAEMVASRWVFPTETREIRHGK